MARRLILEMRQEEDVSEEDFKPVCANCRYLVRRDVIHPYDHIYDPRKFMKVCEKRFQCCHPNVGIRYILQRAIAGHNCSRWEEKKDG